MQSAHRKVHNAHTHAQMNHPPATWRHIFFFFLFIILLGLIKQGRQADKLICANGKGGKYENHSCACETIKLH